MPLPVRPHPPAPLLPVAAGLIVGIAADGAWGLQTASCVSAWCAAALGMWSCGPHRWVRPLLLVLAAICTGALLHNARFRHLPDNHVAHYVGAEAPHVSLTGTVLQAPRLIHPTGTSVAAAISRPPRTRFVLALQSAETDQGPLALVGMVEVSVPEPVRGLHRGDQIRAFGKLIKPTPPDNPGQWDWALAKRRQGIHALLICAHLEAIEVLPPLPGGAWTLLYRIRLEVRARLLDQVLADQPGSRSLLEAMVLGQRGTLDPQIREAFRRTGTAHFLALSGLHVGLLALFIWGVGQLVGLSRRRTAVAVLVTLGAYAMMVEPRASVLRASLIATIMCSSALLRRPFSFSNSTAMAAILLLVWDPLQLYHAGFQLSFVVAVGIAYLTPVVAEPALAWCAARGRERRDDAMARKIGVAPADQDTLRTYAWQRVREGALRSVVMTASVCIAAWFAGMPLVATHFNTLYPYGWLFTGLLSPLVFLAMTTAFLKLLVGMVWPTTGLLLGPVLGCTTRLLVAAVDALSQAPACAVEVPSPSSTWLLLYYGFLVAVVCWRRWPQGGPRLRARWPAGLGLLTLLGTAATCLPAKTSANLRIMALDVGAGSATLLQWPDGQVWLVDAGAMGAREVGSTIVLPALRQWRIRRVDLAVISHADADHYSGFLALCDRGTINRLLVSKGFEQDLQSSRLGKALQHKLATCGVRVDQVAAPALLPVDGPCRAEILWPPPNWPAGGSVNDASLVLKVSHHGHAILLPGDIERDATEHLLAGTADLHADILFMPHHGAVHAATRRLLDRVRPRCIVVSGLRPAAAVQRALQNRSAAVAVLSTADCGALQITSTAAGLSVQGFRDADHCAWRADAETGGR